MATSGSGTGASSTSLYVSAKARAIMKVATSGWRSLTWGRRTSPEASWGIGTLLGYLSRKPVARRVPSGPIYVRGRNTWTRDGFQRGGKTDRPEHYFDKSRN